MKRMTNWLPYAALVVLVTILLRGTLGSGYPMYFENYGSYVSKLLFLKNNGGTLFTPNWYFGYEISRYYPPLMTSVTYVAGSVIGDMSLAFNLISYFAYILLICGVYAFLAGEGMQRWSACIAAGLFATSHVVVSGAQGFYWESPHLLGFALIPYMLILIRRWLRQGRMYLAIAVGGVVGMVLLCNIVAFIEALFIGASYMAVAGGFRKRFALQMLAAAVSAVMVAGWWLVPAILPHGFGTYLTTAGSYTLDGLVRFIGSATKDDHTFLMSVISVPGVFAVAGIVSLWGRKLRVIDRFAIAVSVIALVLVFTHAARGYRYLVDVALALAIVSGRFIDRLLVWRMRYGPAISAAVITVGVGFVLYAAVIPGDFDIRVSTTAYQDTVVYRVATAVHDLMQPGDVVYVKYSDGFHDGPMAFNVFYPDARQAGGGYSAGNHNDDVGRIGSYIRSGDMPKTLDSLFRQYGISYIVVNRPQLEENGAFDVLLRRYSVVFEYQYMSVLSTDYHAAHPSDPYQYWQDPWRRVGALYSYLAGLSVVLFIAATTAVKVPKRAR